MRRWLYGLSCLAAAALWQPALPRAQTAAAPPEEVDVALVLAIAAVLVVVSAVLLLGGARLLGLSAPRAAGGFAGFVGQPAILAFAVEKGRDERIESGYAALFALAIIGKIVAVQVIAAVM